jgi:meiotic recombination protein DMC1
MCDTNLFLSPTKMSDIKKLQDAGLTTVGSVLQGATRDLLAIKGITEARIDKIKEGCKKLDCRGNKFKTGLEMKEKRQTIVKVRRILLLFSRH